VFKSVQFWAGKVACGGVALVASVLGQDEPSLAIGVGTFLALGGGFVFMWYAMAEDDAKN